MEMNLDRIREFARRAGFLRSVPFSLVHIVGTNGKGSTSAFVEALAVAHGVRVGGFSSPHLVSFRERVRVNGRMLDETAWLTAANTVWDSAQDLSLTYFEFMTACAVTAFVQTGVELGVLEAGLGGTWDATGVFPADVLLLASMGLDHQHVLGENLADIARDKAGAIRPGQRVFCVGQEPEAGVVLTQAAAEQGAMLTWTTPVAESASLGLLGPYQRANAGLALAGWRAARGLEPDSPLTEAEQNGLARAFVPGRLQQAVLDGQELLLDAAHNVPALQALLTSLAGLEIRPGGLVFTCLKDKDLREMAPLAARLTEGPIVAPELAVPRARPAAEVARALGGRAQTAPDVLSALRMLQSAKGPVLVCGSLYLLGALYTQRPQLLTFSRA